MPAKVKVYLEVGSKRVFAGALDWPGWCRSGRDEESALDAVVEYGSRYRSALGRLGRELTPPRTRTGLHVAERLGGNSTTDFGAPGRVPCFDELQVDDAAAKRLAGLLKACWTELDRIAQTAQGKSLRKGPRGGGRDLDKVRKHVLEAEGSYLSVLGGKPDRSVNDVAADLARTHAAFLEALAGRFGGRIGSKGPRGGERWPPRYAVRRAAWHGLDHAWEIEERIE
ncbi:hypothetical protein BH18CHL2_BH18CHL2_00610 [soil metagenome]